MLVQLLTVAAQALRHSDNKRHTFPPSYYTATGPRALMPEPCETQQQATQHATQHATQQATQTPQDATVSHTAAQTEGVRALKLSTFRGRARLVVV